MAQGVYGTTIPANVNPSQDVEIWYNYRSARTNDFLNTNNYEQLSPTCLVPVTAPSLSYIQEKNLEGMYSLRLPLAEFSKKGFYSVYIKPSETPAIINDVAPLSTFPDVKGIVIDTNQFSGNTNFKALLQSNNALVGYRIIYVDNGVRQTDVRIITSNNKCEPMVQSTGAKTTVYRYNDNSSLVFITVTPSTAPSFKPNSTPSIGAIGQKILITNTKFEPIHIELEMVEHDADTVATLVAGSQLRSLDEGLITTYNTDDEIVMQQEIYTLKDRMTQKPIYEVRKVRDNIDFTQELP